MSDEVWTQFINVWIKLNISALHKLMEKDIIIIFPFQLKKLLYFNVKSILATIFSSVSIVIVGVYFSPGTPLTGTQTWSASLMWMHWAGSSAPPSLWTEKPTLFIISPSSLSRVVSSPPAFSKFSKLLFETEWTSWKHVLINTWGSLDHRQQIMLKFEFLQILPRILRDIRKIFCHKK